jgi:hypothetical protein
MKVQEIIQLTSRDLPVNTRSVATDRTASIAAAVEIPNRIRGPQERLASQDIFVGGDPADGVITELPPGLNLARMSLPTTPHSRDIEIIKAQIARLPGQTEQ